jgi:hypothetical protein
LRFLRPDESGVGRADALEAQLAFLMSLPVIDSALHWSAAIDRGDALDKDISR